MFELQNVTSDLVLVDKDVDKMTGEVLDLQHGSIFLGDAKIQASKGMKPIFIQFTNDILCPSSNV